MMTRERELLQQALDALDRAISDDRAYIRECKDASEAIRAHLAAQPAPGEPVALESVHLTRDTSGMCKVRVNGRLAIHDNGDIIDHMATLEWFAHPPAAPDHFRDLAEKVGPAAAPAPDGWVMVPREPTQAMRKAAADAWIDCDSKLILNKAAAAIRAAIAASPAAPAAPVVPLTDERITKALRRAFSLGQTYWQQADSDSYKQNAKSDETRQKFETLIVETLNGITGGSK